MTTAWRFARFVICVAMMAAPVSASAQWRPSGPIKLYVGFGPGSSTDILARILADRLASRLGQPVVVENKVGATGILASDAVAKSQVNGLSLVMLTGAHATSAATNSKLPYRAIEDFSMISLLASYGLVFRCALIRQSRALRT